MLEKLLSHRARGFSDIENSRGAVQSACQYSVPFIEIDTRASLDGKLYVYHDAIIKYDGKKVNISQTPSDILDKIYYKNGEKLLLFEDCLAIFKSRKFLSQKLCIDIKDFGYESEHHDLVGKYGLEDSVVFISWIPQTLFRLAELNNKYSLVLSHVNLLGLKGFGRFVSDVLKNKIIGFGWFVLLGKEKFLVDLSIYKHGYQHAFVADELPEEIVSILKGKGGVCIHKYTLSKRLISFCTKHDISLWVFSTKEYFEFMKYDISGVDVIFSDNALNILKNHKMALEQ